MRRKMLGGAYVALLITAMFMTGAPAVGARTANPPRISRMSGARFRASLPFALHTGLVSSRDARVAPALQLTQHVWHPACGRLAVSVDPVASTGLAPSADLGDIAGWASPGECLIHLAAGSRWLGGPELCETVLHEGGHVAGYYNARGVRLSDGTIDHAHSPDPRSIMFPTQFVIRGVGTIRIGRRVIRRVGWSGVDRRCLRAYHAYGSS